MSRRASQVVLAGERSSFRCVYLSGWCAHFSSCRHMFCISMPVRERVCDPCISAGLTLTPSATIRSLAIFAIERSNNNHQVSAANLVMSVVMLTSYKPHIFAIERSQHAPDGGIHSSPVHKGVVQSNLCLIADYLDTLPHSQKLRKLHFPP